MRINVGCGMTPTQGWLNLDNSPSLRLARIPVLPAVLRGLGLLTDAQADFIQFARANRVVYGDAVKGLALEDESVEVVYSSHMLEHLDRREAARFLREVMRILRPGGLVRIAVPDIRKLVSDYVASHDADAFVESTDMWADRPADWVGRVRHMLVGARNHLWMYDGESLVKLLQSSGFVEAEACPAGVTGIDSPGSLDLCERHEATVYVEARKSRGQ